MIAPRRVFKLGRLMYFPDTGCLWVYLGRGYSFDLGGHGWSDGSPYPAVYLGLFTAWRCRYDPWWRWSFHVNRD